MNLSKLILIGYILSSSSGLVILKMGTNSSLPISLENHKINVHLNFHTIVGLLLYIISFTLYVYLVSKNDLGYIIPLTAAFVYIIVFVASYIFFRESFTLLKISGIAFILVGLLLLNLKR